MDGSRGDSPSAPFDGRSGAATPVVLPASFAQVGLWSFAQLVPELGVYNLGCPFDAAYFDCSADPDIFEEAFAIVVRRHEALRTCLDIRNGEVVQLVYPEVPIQIERTDLRELPVAEREAREEEITTAEAAAPIPLDRAPLWRARLIRRTDDDWGFVFVVHHAVFDAYSIGNLISELLVAYRALAAGTVPDLPELVIEYADFAGWQRQRLASGELDSQLEYWMGVLADLPDPLELPSQFPTRHSEPGYLGESTSFNMPSEIGRHAQLLARRKRTTPFVVLLSGYAALLSRLTGQTNIIVGSPVSGRLLPELAPVMGMFVNTLILRLDCSGDPGFGELVDRVRDTVIDALENQEVPYARLVEIIAPNRTRNGMPLHQVMFNLLPLHNAIIGIHNGISEVDLLLDLAEIDGGYDGRLEYRSHLLTTADADAFGRRLGRLLAAALDTPELPISRLPILEEAERARIEGWNATGRDYRGSTVPELLGEAMGCFAGRPAVVAADGSLSYAELAVRVNKLARWLVEVGVRPGDVVGICLERGLELVVAVHAVQAAGAAYLPLEPDYPPQRLAELAADARTRLILTVSGLTDRLPERAVLAMDVEAERIDAQPADPPGVSIAPDALAYVIYTSGSTGVPKGVGVSHRAIANRLRWMQDSYPLSEADAVLHKTPFSFDVSIWELCWPLLVGARMVLAEPGGHRLPDYLVPLMRQHRVSVAHFVPSMLEALLSEPDLPDRLASLRHLICSGEALRPELAARAHILIPTAALHNLYGPTEAAVDVTQHTYQAGQQIVPIGRPVPNTHIEILDPAAQRLPIGAPGELCIGGVQVALGYLHRPALTAERFVPDPYGQPGQRLYRTGDLARWLPDGNLEYLGRLDRQVKIRGFRIELGEIESALTSQPGIRSAAVIAADNPDGSRRLIGYLVTDPDTSELPAADLIDRLRNQLPEHLIPTTFVQLAELPLTRSGKLDHSALPTPDPRATTSYVPPRTPTEHTIAHIFGEVLAVHPVGTEDDFLALGGDSIRSLKIIARLREHGYHLAVGELFTHPTIRQLASQLDHAAAESNTGRTTSDTPPAPTPAPAFALLNPRDLALLTRRPSA